MEKYKELVQKALAAREKAYAPYSHFKVGAALLGKSGVIYPGCNVENASYTPTNCAERTAFFTAVAQGEREFDAIAIVGGLDTAEALDYVTPCGVCRQVMMEFCSYENFEIIVAKNEDEYKVFTLKELMPESFGPNDLK